MRIAGIDVVIFAIYILFVLALGLYGAKRTLKTKRDYFLAGDKVPWWMVGGSIVASNISSHHFVGVMGVAYSIGFAAMTIEWGAILIGFNALLWIFLPHYLRNGFYTMPEFLERRFSRTARTSFAGLILLTYLFVEIAAVLGLGAIALHEIFGINVNVSIVAIAAFTGVYAILGGLRSVIWTEMLQLLVLLTGGIVLSVAVISKVGGWSGVMATSKDWGLFLPASSKSFPWTMWLGGITSISVFYCAANQFIVQRVLAAKDEWHARMGVVFTDYLKFLMPLIILVPGLMAIKLYPNLERPDLAFPTLVENLLPSGLVGLVLAGLIAAVMSHISGAVNSCTTIATIDFYLPFIKKDADDRQAVRFGKMAGVVILVLGVFWAQVLSLSKKPLFLYLLEAYGYFAPGIATMFLLGTFWKRTTNAGAMAAGILTIPLSFALQFAIPDVAPLARATIVFWSCMAIAVLVSLVTKPKPEAEIESLMWHRSSLTLPKQHRHLVRGLRNPAIWWAIITVAVLFMYVRFAVDHNPPSVRRIVGTASAGKVTFKIGFSEPVTDFTEKSVELTGGTIAEHLDRETGKQVPDISGNGNTFTVNVVPDGTGAVRCTVPAGAASDNSGNRNARAAVRVVTPFRSP